MVTLSHKDEQINTNKGRQQRRGWKKGKNIKEDKWNYIGWSWKRLIVRERENRHRYNGIDEDKGNRRK